MRLCEEPLSPSHSIHSLHSIMARKRNMTDTSNAKPSRAPPKPKKGALPVELLLVRRNGMSKALLKTITDICTYSATNFRGPSSRKALRPADYSRLAQSISAGVEAHYPRQVWHCVAGRTQPEYNIRYRPTFLVVFNVKCAKVSPSISI